MTTNRKRKRSPASVSRDRAEGQTVMNVSLPSSLKDRVTRYCVAQDLKVSQWVRVVMREALDSLGVE